MNKLKPFEQSFDELLLSKNLFENNQKRIRSITANAILKNTYVDICYQIVKYLLHSDVLNSRPEYKQPQEVRDLIFKYMLALSYMHTVEKEDYLSELYNDDLENLRVGTTIDQLINLTLDGQDLFSKIYQSFKIENIKNKHNLTYEQIETKLEQYNSTKAKRVLSVVQMNYNFYSFKPNLQYYDEHPNANKFDLIVSRCIEDNTFEKFNFEICDDTFEDFTKNFEYPTNNIDTMIRSHIITFGHIIHFIINQNEKPTEINLKGSILKLVTLNKEYSPKTINFLDRKSCNANESGYFIKWKLINDFNFIYNDQKYKITKDGIIKL